MTKEQNEKIASAKQALVTMLGNFIGRNQAAVLGDLLRGEERLAIAEQILSVWETIKTMPVSYEMDGKEQKDVTVQLHYFLGGMDVWVTEKDFGEAREWTPVTPQLQAFGLIDLNGEPEMGYVSLQEVTEAGMELDLHWVKTDLESIYKKARNRGYN